MFVATGQNKVVQHLEGGVIREILVREGDIVVPGQTLINLDDTAAKTEMRRLLLRETRLLTTDARLQAEMREEAAIVFPLTSRPGSMTPTSGPISKARSSPSSLAATASRARSPP